MAKVQQKSEKVTAFGGYFSFWTINPYSEDIVKAWLDNEKKIGVPVNYIFAAAKVQINEDITKQSYLFFCFYYG